MSKPHTVIVILDAKKGKEKELESALQAVVQPSRSEKACLEYRLHKDNAVQFILGCDNHWNEKVLSFEAYSLLKSLIYKIIR